MPATGRGYRPDRFNASTLQPRRSEATLLRRRLLHYVRVENPQPVGSFFFPNAAGVVGAGYVFAIEGALDRYFVSAHDDVRLIGESIPVTERKRLDVPLLHVVQLLLHIVYAIGSNDT